MSILLTLKGVIAAFAGVIPLARPAAPVIAHMRRPPAAPVRPPVSVVTRMTPAQQWDKVSGVLTSAIASAANAKELQAGAAQQLDLATYALYNLFDELSAIMSEPLVREAAVVHRLPSKVYRTPSQALAA